MTSHTERNPRPMTETMTAPRVFTTPQAPADVVRVKDASGNFWTYDPRNNLVSVFDDSEAVDRQPWRAEDPDAVFADQWSGRHSWSLLCDSHGPITEAPAAE